MESATHNDQAQKMRGLLGVTLALFAILVLRLFYLQVATSEDYERESEDNRIDQKRLKAPRGLIRARGGEVLAQNGAFYTISLVRSNKKNYLRAVAALQEAIGGSEITRKYNPRHRIIRLKRDVDFRTVSIIEERLKDEWPLDIEIEAKRAYPESTLAAHLLGYMGLVQEKDLDQPHVTEAKNYRLDDFIGRTGLEQVYEGTLRGEDGVRYIEVDAKNRTRRDFPEREQPPQPGGDLWLTIDFEVQKAAERALPDTLSGSIVALDPRNGAVLALASNPTFNPNVFVSFQEQEERTRLLQSDTKDLLNRATQGTYPPGSTLKLVAAVAALETGITDTLSTFAACAGSLQVGDHVFRCFKRDGHGELNLLEAVEASCNIYFLQLAQIMGIETWWEYGDKFGFGQPTGINLSPEEMRGQLPSRQYYQEREGWVQGHLMNLVIGQGDMLATPIQMARYVAALGNGGTLVTPYVYGPPPAPKPIPSISPATFEIIKKCMRRVIYGEHGTGKKVQIEGIEIAGKSGTAQVANRNDDAWFIAFAPYDEPTIAVAVVVEGGGGGGAVGGHRGRQSRAGPTAGRITSSATPNRGTCA
jgi:penicillin-binding protein 2